MQGTIRSLYELVQGECRARVSQYGCVVLKEIIGLSWF